MSIQRYLLFLLAIVGALALYDALFECYLQSLDAVSIRMLLSATMRFVCQRAVPAVLVLIIAWPFGVWRPESGLGYKLATVASCVVAPPVVAILDILVACYGFSFCI